MAIRIADEQLAPQANADAAAGARRTANGYRVTTPLPDLYTTASVAEALLVRIPPQQFLLENFFGVERFFDGRFLVVDTKKNAPNDWTVCVATVRQRGMPPMLQFIALTNARAYLPSQWFSHHNQSLAYLA